MSVKIFVVVAVVAVAALISVSQASVIKTKSIGNCPGSEGYPLQLIEGSIPDVIYIPGTTLLNVRTLVKEDLPSDLMIKLKLKKLEPFPLDVPCLDGLGSCPYDICTTIENLADTICPSFPPSQPCGCPLLAGDIDLKNVELPVPDFGPILGSLMAGNYNGRATFYANSAPDTLLGCIDMAFKFEKA